MATSVDKPFDALFELTSDLAVIVDTESESVLDANGKTQEALEYPLSRLQSMQWMELFPLGEREPLASMQSRIDSSGDKAGFLHCHLLREDGSRFPCELRMHPFATSAGEHMLVLFRDVSAQYRAREEIHLRNLAIASVRSGVVMADARQADLPLIYVNKGFERITGYTAHEALGRSCRFLQGTDRAQPQLEILRRCLSNGDGCDVRLRNYRKDGTLFWNELHISPVRDEDGLLTHFIGIQFDVTDRVNSREALERSEERYRMLADNVRDLILRRSIDGTIDFVSPSAQTFVGHTEAECLGLSFLDLVHPEDRDLVAETSRRIESTGDTANIRFRMQRPGAEPLWVESSDSLASETDHGHRGTIVSVIRDITLRRKAEEETKRALERERELNEIKTRFIRVVSHEFRTPLTAIMASSSLIREYGDSLPKPKRDRHLANVEQSVNRMRHLIDQVIFANKAEAQIIQLQRSELALVSWIENLIEQLALVYPGHAVELQTKLSREQVFNLDAGLLHHILQNLLTNALKYSPVENKVDLLVDANTDELRLRVTDHGIGIPQKDQEELFSAFHRAENVGTISGTGLGLHIVLRSVQAHEGQIRFCSREGEGTTFEVTLPL